MSGNDAACRCAAAKQVAWLAPVVVLLLLGAPAARGDSAVELLPGFDRQRIASTFPADEAPAVGELAKLLYRLGNVDRGSMAERAGGFDAIGEAVQAAGRVESVDRLAVPSGLAELLEFDEIHQVTLSAEPPGGEDSAARAQSASLSRGILLFTHDLPQQAAVGDRLSGLGVVIGHRDEAAGRTLPVVASASVEWFPADPERTGWRLLADAGVDVGLIAEAARRDRQPLTAEDADAFYALLGAAARIARQSGDASLPPGESVAPLELLQSPDEYSGEWIRMRLETVRITRVAVPEPRRRDEIGSDHYYQIDAVGDLGDVQIQIQVPGGETVRFDNTYPVSVVAAELPETIAAPMRAKAGGDATVVLLDLPIVVEGFFYRLWSYESALLGEQAEAAQFGPLVVAAKLESRAAVGADPFGVSRLGWFAAAAAVLAIIATAVWTGRTARRDRQVRRRRQEQEPSRLPWAGDAEDRPE